MKFILTIDTEGDNQWDHGRKLTVENIRYVPRFQELCDKYGIKPNYLVTSEVCEDPFARELFTDYIDKGKAEIGAHLHPWTTPPFLEKEGYRKNDINHAFASELQPGFLREKIINITHQIEASFGIHPTSFRSGRYGFNESLAEILAENSYEVDSSVTPYVSWSKQSGVPGGVGGPNFIHIPPFPYKIGSLLEIPITILPTRFPLNVSKTIARNYFRYVNGNLILRAFRKLYYSTQPLWLRPTPEMNMELLKELLKEAVNKKLPFITMMFHSSELMPGCSQYRPDESAIEELYVLLEGFFTRLSDKNIGSVTLTEAAKSVNL